MRKFNVFVMWSASSLLACSAFASHVYVRANAAPGGDGHSWRTAFDSIDAAITNIADHPEATTFWVAKGLYSPSIVYTPSDVIGGAVGPGEDGAYLPYLKTYNLPDGVTIYGGFQGHEKCLEDRQMVNSCLNSSQDRVDPYLTVLNGCPSNSWHVITAGDDIAQTGVKISINDLTITGGYAIGPDAGTLNSTFNITSLAYAHDAGGGIYARFGSEVKVRNVNFHRNACSGKNAVVVGISDEPVLNGGGAIALFDASTRVDIENSYFTQNESIDKGGGGAINNSFNAALNVSSSQFDYNSAGRSGGAIRTKDAGDVSVKGCSFESNMSNDPDVPVGNQSGGAFTAIDNNVEISDCTFRNNFGQQAGGAIFFHSPFDDGSAYSFNINHCIFENNKAGPVGGGAIFIFGTECHPATKVTIKHSKFSHNYAGLGGALNISSMDAKISKSHFNGNLADAWGGAISVNNFADCLFYLPISFEERKKTEIKKSQFISNTTQGVQPIPPPLPFYYTPPGFLFVLAIDAVHNFLTPVDGFLHINPGEITTGGGGVAVYLSGVANISNCHFEGNSNSATEGNPANGGGILVGGFIGDIPFPPTPPIAYNNFNYATAVVKDSIFSGNSSEQAVAVDLANVGDAPQGVSLTLINSPIIP
jgi:predicted outer membrane repeat protein